MQSANHYPPSKSCYTQSPIRHPIQSKHHHGHHLLRTQFFGIMVLMDSISGKALFVSAVKNETNKLYFAAICSLKANLFI